MIHTIIHNRDTGFVIYQGREREDSDLVGQLLIVSLHKLDVVLVRVVIDGFQLLENFGAGFAVVIVCSKSKAKSKVIITFTV